MYFQLHYYFLLENKVEEKVKPTESGWRFLYILYVNIHWLISQDSLLMSPTNISSAKMKI